MSETCNEPDYNYWKAYVIDTEYQAEITEGAETVQVFDSFLLYWLKKATLSKVTLFVVPSFKDYEFLITPDEEFYVSSLLGEIIGKTVAKANESRDQHNSLTSFMMTNN